MTGRYLNYTLYGFIFTFPLSIPAANIFLLLSLILWLLNINKNTIKSLLKDKVLISMLVIIGTLFISTLLSPAVNESFFLKHSKPTYFSVIYKLVYPLVFYIIAVTSVKKETLRKMILFFLTAMFINELRSYIVFFNVIDTQTLHNLKLIPKHMNPSDPSPMFHSFYSIFLVISILLLIELSMHEKNKKLKFFYILYILSATANLFINGGRLGQIIFFIAISVYVLSKFKAGYKTILSLVISFSLIFILAFNFSPIFQKRTKQSIRSLELMIYQDNFASSWGQRAALYLAAYKYLTSSVRTFLFGAKAGISKKAFMSYTKNHNPYLYKFINTRSHLHNTYLQLWLEGGIIPVLALIYIFIHLLRNYFSPLNAALLITMYTAMFFDVFIYWTIPYYLFLFVIIIIKKGCEFDSVHIKQQKKV